MSRSVMLVAVFDDPETGEAFVDDAYVRLDDRFGGAEMEEHVCANCGVPIWVVTVFIGPDAELDPWPSCEGRRRRRARRRR